jgi:hypothetical protein
VAETERVQLPQAIGSQLGRVIPTLGHQAQSKSFALLGRAKEIFQSRRWYLPDFPKCHDGCCVWRARRCGNHRSIHEGIGQNADSWWFGSFRTRQQTVAGQGEGAERAEGNRRQNLENLGYARGCGQTAGCFERGEIVKSCAYGIENAGYIASYFRKHAATLAGGSTKSPGECDCGSDV